MSANLTVEIKAPEIVNVLQKLIDTIAYHTDPSIAEQAARARIIAAPTSRPTTPAQTAQQTKPVSAPVQVAPATVPNAPTLPTQAYSIAPANPRQPTPTYAPAPVTPPQYQAPAPVNPTPIQAPVAAAPAYALDDLARAAGIFADTAPANRQKVLDLIRQYGLQQLSALPKEQYGAFATALREMGAKI